VRLAGAGLIASFARPGGNVAELDFRLTICLRKIGGQWIVMHEHHSIPAS
jgi:ketosteroid isomerase-like protein